MGRLTKKSQIIEQETPVEALPPQVKSEAEATLDAVLDNFSDQMMEDIAAQAEEIINVELPMTQQNESQPPPEIALPTTSHGVENVEIPQLKRRLSLLKCQMLR